MNLYDILQQSAGGNGFGTLARMYGLDEAQVRRAVEAFTPAFSAALRQNTANQQQLMSFMQALASGRHAGYYDQPDLAYSGAGMADGNAILGHLFGSKELSRAVANQVAASTGLGEAILKQMLPVIAAMIMGGLFKQGTSGGGGSFLETILKQMTGAMTGGSMGGGGMFGGGSAQPETRTRYDAPDRGQGGTGSGFPGGADNPFGRMFEEMIGGMFGGGGRSAPDAGFRPTAEASTPDAPPSANPRRAPTGPDIFGDLFAPSRKMGEAYQKSMEDVVDGYLKGMSRFR